MPCCDLYSFTPRRPTVKHPPKPPRNPFKPKH